MKNVVLGLVFATMAFFGVTASAGENGGGLVNNLNVQVVWHGTGGWHTLGPGQSIGGVGTTIDVDGVWVPNNGIPGNPGSWVKIPGLTTLTLDEAPFDPNFVGPLPPSVPCIKELISAEISAEYDYIPVTPTVQPFPNPPGSPSVYDPNACPAWIRLIYPNLIPPAPPGGGGGPGGGGTGGA